MKIVAMAFLLPVLLSACLELTPNVSTEFSEVEARAVLEKEIRIMCNHKKSKIPAILNQIDASTAEPTADHWVFDVDGEHALVFPSGLASGPYIRGVNSGSCR